MRTFFLLGLLAFAAEFELAALFELWGGLHPDIARTIVNAKVTRNKASKRRVFIEFASGRVRPNFELNVNRGVFNWRRHGECKV